MSGGLQFVVFFRDEELADLDGAGQFSVAHEALVEHVFQYFEEDAGLRPVRLLGLTVSNLTTDIPLGEPAQMELPFP